MSRDCTGSTYIVSILKRVAVADEGKRTSLQRLGLRVLILFRSIIALFSVIPSCVRRLVSPSTTQDVLGICSLSNVFEIVKDSYVSAKGLVVDQLIVLQDCCLKPK